MKTRTHGLDERETELVKLLTADCKSTGDTLKDIGSEISQGLISKITDKIPPGINDPSMTIRQAAPPFR